MSSPLSMARRICSAATSRRCGTYPGSPTRCGSWLRTCRWSRRSRSYCRGAGLGSA
jgi:hypothetical protein